VIGDAIFHSIRYDALLVDEGPRIPLPLLLACACLARERIVLAGDPHELPPPSPTSYGVSLGWATTLVNPSGSHLDRSENQVQQPAQEVARQDQHGGHE
jgi:hypothetical protein